MKRTILVLLGLLISVGIYAQDYHINLHNSGSVIYNNSVSDIHEIRFSGSQPATMVLQAGCGITTFPINAFDSITFVRQEEPPAGDTVYLNYNGSSVEVINPFSNDGVTVTTSNADVTVNSTKDNVPYVISGNSSNGSLTRPTR